MDKSYSDIHQGKKRRSEGQELNVSHVQPNKKFKAKKPGDLKYENPRMSRTKTPFYGECRYCLHKGHVKKDCQLYRSEQAQRVFRTDVLHHPVTKEASTTPVLWKKVDGKIVVTHITQVKDNKVTENESEIESGPSTPPASPYVERNLSPIDYEEEKVNVTHIETEVLSEAEVTPSKGKRIKSKIPKVTSCFITLTDVIEKIAKLSEEGKAIGRAIKASP